VIVRDVQFAPSVDVAPALPDVEPPATKKFDPTVNGRFVPFTLYPFDTLTDAPVITPLAPSVTPPILLTVESTVLLMFPE
jgi:hypothetical protein